MLLRLTQPPLVGLTMDRHEQLAELPQNADRHRSPTDVGLRTPPRRQCPDQDQAVLSIAAGLDDPQRGGVLRPDVDHTLDDGVLRAGAHQGGVRPGSEPQSET